MATCRSGLGGGEGRRSSKRRSSDAPRTDSLLLCQTYGGQSLYLLTESCTGSQIIELVAGFDVCVYWRRVNGPGGVPGRGPAEADREPWGHVPGPVLTLTVG